MQKKKKIVAVHLLNDFSGSPLVFSQTLNALQTAGHEIILHTGNGGEGFLDRLNIPVVRFPYRFHRNHVLRLIVFMWSQLITFIQILKYRNEDVCIYVNTLLPFGAALGAKLIGKPVIYHLHETSIRPFALLRFLQKTAEKTATRAIYVSLYLHRELPLKGVDSKVVYNALPEEFEKETNGFEYKTTGSAFVVLMVCSLKKYKGIFEFIALAKRHPELQFEMVINTRKEEIELFFKNEQLPVNLCIHPIQKNLHPFYRRASLVVNLTNPGLCIETFGMTLLEAMSYGIPVIAPPVGGPSEIVINGENGFTADVRNEYQMDSLLQQLSARKEDLIRLSANARSSSQKFSSEGFNSRILELFREI